MKPSAKLMTAALLLIGGASTASAQSYWYYGDYGLKQRGYYGTPYDGGPQYGSGGGDQYGYGPAYSYGKQAPAPPPCDDIPTLDVRPGCRGIASQSELEAGLQQTTFEQCCKVSKTFVSS
jgi:hypothetical protein